MNSATPVAWVGTIDSVVDSAAATCHGDFVADAGVATLVGGRALQEDFRRIIAIVVVDCGVHPGQSEPQPGFYPAHITTQVRAVAAYTGTAPIAGPGVIPVWIFRGKDIP